MNYQFAYLFWNLLIGLPIWLLLFIKRPDLRKQMLIMSLLAGCLGPISEIWYLKDYWHPQTFNGWTIGLEDFLFGFFVGGIASTLYEETFGRKHLKIRSHKKHWHILTWSFLALGFIIFNLLVGSFGINSIYASTIVFCLLAICLIIFRPDLALSSLTSGLLFALIFLGGYHVYLNFYPDIFSLWWKSENLSGQTFLNIPIEEIFWAITWGFVAGPIYEFYSGTQLKNSR